MKTLPKNIQKLKKLEGLDLSFNTELDLNSITTVLMKCANLKEVSLFNIEETSFTSDDVEVMKSKLDGVIVSGFGFFD